jgi:hypothetical protein
MSIALLRVSFGWRSQWRRRGRERRLGSGGVSRDSCDCLAEGRCYIAEPAVIIIVVVHMPDGLGDMVARVANRKMGCMASPRRVSSASLRGARGSLTDKKFVRRGQLVCFAGLGCANELNVMALERHTGHPSFSRGRAKAGNCTALPETRAQPRQQGRGKLIRRDAPAWEPAIQEPKEPEITLKTEGRAQPGRRGGGGINVPPGEEDERSSKRGTRKERVGGGLSGSYRARAVICGTVRKEERPEFKAGTEQSQATGKKKKRVCKKCC